MKPSDETPAKVSEPVKAREVPASQEAIDYEAAQCRAMVRKFPVSRADCTAVVVALADQVASFQVDQVQQAGVLVEEQRKVRSLEAELAEAKTANEAMRSELRITQQDANNEAEELRERATTAESAIAKADAETDAARAELERARAAHKADLDAWGQREKAMAAEVEQLRAKLDAANAWIRKCDDELDATEDRLADARVQAMQLGDLVMQREAAMRAAAAKVARDHGLPVTAEAIERLPLSTGEATPAATGTATVAGGGLVCPTCNRMPPVYEAISQADAIKAAVTADRERFLAWFEWYLAQPGDNLAKKPAFCLQIMSGAPAPGTVKP